MTSTPNLFSQFHHLILLWKRKNYSVTSVSLRYRARGAMFHTVSRWARARYRTKPRSTGTRANRKCSSQHDYPLRTFRWPIHGIQNLAKRIRWSAKSKRHLGSSAKLRLKPEHLNHIRRCLFEYSRPSTLSSQTALVGCTSTLYEVRFKTRSATADRSWAGARYSKRYRLD